jgi:hypothetical protein
MTDDPLLSPRELSEAEMQAIMAFDFERAHDLAHAKTVAVDRTADLEEAHYLAEAERLTRENEEQYSERLQGISRDYFTETTNYKSVWQSLCRSLILRQRAEASELEHRWSAARSAEGLRKAEHAQVELRTACVLAMCDKFDEAIETRNRARSLLTDDQAPSLRKIDADYTTQYRVMIARHETEFRDLFGHLNSLIQGLKDKAEGQRSAAQAMLKSQNATDKRRLIEKVMQSPVSPIGRDRVIHAFSPRSKGSPKASGTGRSLTSGSPAKP